MVPVMVLGIIVGLLQTQASRSLAEDTVKADYVGAEMCLACHSGQESFKSNPHAKKMMKGKGIDFEKTCESCHGPGSLHAEAAGDRSNPGFATIKNLKTAKASDVAASCLACHQDAKRLHWQGSVHESRNVSCAACHSVHEAKSPKKMLVKATEAETCYQCHKDIKGQMRRSAHMPVREGKMSCKDCHNAHGSATDKNLAADSVNTLCYKCHADKRGPLIWEHAPVRENCLTCHSPHGSHNDSMLVDKRPMLCQKCHSHARHPSAIYDKANIDVQANRAFGRSCTNCHQNIHGSNHPSGMFFVR